MSEDTVEQVYSFDFCLLREKARLAACGNILPGVTSVYEWQGKIETETEVSLILKTKSDKTEALTEFVVENHPYDTPCVVFVPVEAGHQPGVRKFCEIRSIYGNYHSHNSLTLICYWCRNKHPYKALFGLD